MPAQETPHDRCTPRRLSRRRLTVLGTAGRWPVPAWAPAGWTPTQPITILVGFAPGGSADQIARQLSFAAKSIIPVPVVVLNRVGAAGAIAAQAAAEAKPDGYTLFVGGGSETTSVGNFKQLPYDPRKSFTPVIKVSRAPSILAVRGRLEVRRHEGADGRGEDRRRRRSRTAPPAKAASSTPPRWCGKSRPASSCCTCRTRARPTR